MLDSGAIAFIAGHTTQDRRRVRAGGVARPAGGREASLRPLRVPATSFSEVTGTRHQGSRPGLGPSARAQYRIDLGQPPPAGELLRSRGCQPDGALAAQLRQLVVNDRLELPCLEPWRGALDGEVPEPPDERARELSGAVGTP
jgi:hypothetical protein